MDDGAAADLERDGYARLGPLLGPDELARCREVFDQAVAQLGQPIGERWFPTGLLPDPEVRAFITDGLRSIIQPKLSALFDPAVLELIQLDLSVKPASEHSELGPHQDYAIIDEEQAASIYLWIPLVDTDETNGTLHLVPGSHRFANRVRSHHVPATFDRVLDLVHQESVAVRCRAGELVLMVSGVIHHSPPNTSDHLRLAVHGIVKPIAAPLVFYFADEQTPADMVECYEMDLESYHHHVRSGRPAGDLPVRLIDRPASSMGRGEFLEGLDLVRSEVSGGGHVSSGST